MVRQAVLGPYSNVPHPSGSVLDTVTIVLDTHAVYFYLIANYNNPSALAIQVWCVAFFVIYREVTSHHRFQECTGTFQYYRNPDIVLRLG